MTVGRTLWTIILVKLFFFPDTLTGRSHEERGRQVMRELTNAN